MTENQRLCNLAVPQGPVDVVLDTDTYNEIDDQFAIAYLLRSGEKLRTKALYAAPFFNSLSTGPEDGMEKSYQEIGKLLRFMERDVPVFRGSAAFLKDERTPVHSDAARDLARRVLDYSPEAPLYIVAIGAITNVASALLLEPKLAENAVVVWLGGHGRHYHDTREFNMAGDVAAARVVMASGVPFVQLPCGGVVDKFTTSRYELEHWLKGKNPLCDYLVRHTVEEAESYAAGTAWTRVIWDVTAVAWLLNDDGRFMADELRHSPIPEYDNRYAFDNTRHFMKYVSSINRDALFTDLFQKLGK